MEALLIALAFAIASSRRRRSRRVEAPALPAPNVPAPTEGDTELDRFGPTRGTVSVPTGTGGGITFTPGPTGATGPALGPLDPIQSSASAEMLAALARGEQGAPPPITPAPAYTPVPTQPAAPAAPERTGSVTVHPPIEIAPAGASGDRLAAAEYLYRIATTTAAASRGPYRERIRAAQSTLGVTADGLIGAGTARAVYAALGRRIPGIAI